MLSEYKTPRQDLTGKILTPADMARFVPVMVGKLDSASAITAEETTETAEETTDNAKKSVVLLDCE